jgi:hypothetical protein
MIEWGGGGVFLVYRPIFISLLYTNLILICVERFLILKPYPYMNTFFVKCVNALK